MVGLHAAVGEPAVERAGDAPGCVLQEDERAVDFGIVENYCAHEDILVE